MATTTENVAITPEELLALPNSIDFELVDGELVERNMGARSSWVGCRVSQQINNAVETAPKGWVFGSDVGYQCFREDPRKIRKPDVSFIGFGRLEGERLPEGYITIPPDLAVEVLSPNDIAYEVEQKIAEYLAAGVRLVWIIDPDHMTIRIHRRDGSIGWLTEAGELDGEDVLPGFRVPVRSLFPPQAPPA